jgi:ACS family glucarate transporter-like MFS transporter
MNKPSLVRYKVVYFAIALAIITYIDRVCIAQAAGPISADLNLSKEDLGLVMAAFAWSYALFEIPMGWLGDKYGPRRILTFITVWWSIFTVAHAAAWNRTSLIVIRFLFGARCIPQHHQSIQHLASVP